jgi:hypothetical protein
VVVALAILVRWWSLRSRQGTAESTLVATWLSWFWFGIETDCDV